MHRQLPDFPDDPTESAKTLADGPTYLFTTASGCAQLTNHGAICTPMEKTVPEAWLVRLQPK